MPVKLYIAYYYYLKVHRHCDKHINKGLWQCIMVEKGNALLFRQHGQGAGACRHNRIQDTLLQPQFTTVSITFPLSPWWPTGLPLPLTFLTHTHTQTHFQLAKQTLQQVSGLASKEGSDHWLRCGDEEEENSFWRGDRMRPSESQSRKGRPWALS